MKTANLALAVTALVLAGGIYAAFEYGWPSSGDPAVSERRSDAGLHTAAAPVQPADQPVAAPNGKMAAVEPAGAFATAAEVADLRQELADLRAALIEVRRQSRRTVATTDSAEDTVVEKPRMDANTLAQEKQRRLEQLDAQEAGFRKEPADAAWASHTSAQVESALEELAVAPSGVRDLECRAATCRIELAGDTLITEDGNEPMSLNKGLPLLALQLAGSLPGMTAFQVPDGRGGTNTVMYFSRNTDAPPPRRR